MSNAKEIKVGVDAKLDPKKAKDLFSPILTGAKENAAQISSVYSGVFKLINQDINTVASNLRSLNAQLSALASNPALQYIVGGGGRGNGGGGGGGGGFGGGMFLPPWGGGGGGRAGQQVWEAEFRPSDQLPPGPPGGGGGGGRGPGGGWWGGGSGGRGVGGGGFGGSGLQQWGRIGGYIAMAAAATAQFPSKYYDLLDTNSMLNSRSSAGTGLASTFKLARLSRDPVPLMAYNQIMKDPQLKEEWFQVGDAHRRRGAAWWGGFGKLGSQAIYGGEAALGGLALEATGGMSSYIMAKGLGSLSGRETAEGWAAVTDSKYRNRIAQNEAMALHKEQLDNYTKAHPYETQGWQMVAGAAPQTIEAMRQYKDPNINASLGFMSKQLDYRFGRQDILGTAGMLSQSGTTGSALALTKGVLQVEIAGFNRTAAAQMAGAYVGSGKDASNHLLDMFKASKIDRSVGNDLMGVMAGSAYSTQFGAMPGTGLFALLSQGLADKDKARNNLANNMAGLQGFGDATTRDAAAQAGNLVFLKRAARKRGLSPATALKIQQLRENPAAWGEFAQGTIPETLLAEGVGKDDIPALLSAADQDLAAQVGMRQPYGRSRAGSPRRFYEDWAKKHAAQARADDFSTESPADQNTLRMGKAAVYASSELFDYGGATAFMFQHGKLSGRDKGPIVGPPTGSDQAGGSKELELVTGQFEEESTIFVGALKQMKTALAGFNEAASRFGFTLDPESARATGHFGGANNKFLNPIATKGAPKSK